jgi:hypothetical protein
MFRRFFQTVFARLSRKARRAGKLQAARPSPKLRMFLETLDQRLVPSSAAIVSQSGNTLTITEYTAFNDSITETAAFGGKYTIVTSANSGNPQNFSNVSNIVFNAATSGINVLFNSSGGDYNTTGNVSINSTTNFIGLFAEFDGTQNVQGKVTVANTGIGSTTDFVDLGDTFGALTVTGGSAITGNNSSNTFVSVSDTIHNASGSTSVQGTLVDLEGTTIKGATSINFGGGGGYFITDVNLDLGNTSNSSFNTSAPTVNFNGDLSITDLRTRTTDTFQVHNANVSGNLSINVSSISANQTTVYLGNASTPIGGITLTNVSISKNLSVTANISSGFASDVYLVNSSVTGAATLNQTGYYGFIAVFGSNVSGTLSVTQSTLHANLEIAGTGANSLGAVTIKQSGHNGYAAIDEFTSIKGNLSVSQTETNNTSFSIYNVGTVNGSVTVNQSAYDSNISIGLVNVSGATTLAQNPASGDAFIGIENSSLGSGLTISQALTSVPGGDGAITNVDYTTIKGNVSVTQGSGTISIAAFSHTQINGSLTVNQSATVTETDLVYFENGSTLTGNLSVVQLSATDLGEVYLGAAGGEGGGGNNISINGSVTITQNAAGLDKIAYVENASTIGGSVTINQATSTNNLVFIETDTIKGAVKVSQGGGYNNSIFVQNVSINSAATFTQTQAGTGNIIEVDNSLINGSVTANQATGTAEALVEFGGDDINGSLTVTHGINAGGYFAETLIQNDVITGNVSVAQSGGYNNSAYIYNDSISGTLTINQSSASTPFNKVYIDDGTSINGNVSINQTGGNYTDDSVSVGNSSLKAALSVKQTGTDVNTIGFDNASLTGALTLTQGAGYDEFYAYSTTFAGNVSVVGTSTQGSYFDIANSSFSKNLTISETVGNNYLVMSNNSAVIGNVTVNFSGGFNGVDIYDSTIYGNTSLNLGIGQTATNEVYLQSDENASASLTLQGLVTVGMGDGTNTVDIGNNGSVTFNANASFAANISGYNTYNESNTSGPGIVTFRNF